MKRALLIIVGGGLLGLLLGCGADPTACGLHNEPMLRPDGGILECIRSEDCPRPSDLFVCVTDGDQARGCVACKSTRCIRISPYRCP